MIWHGPAAPQLAGVGSIAIAPMDSEGWSSLTGIQLAPPSIVFQTPPAAAPKYATSLLVGSTASAATRPELLGLPLKGKRAAGTLIGRGPIELHAVGPGKAVTSGTAPSGGSSPIFLCASIILSRCWS